MLHHCKHHMTIVRHPSKIHPPLSAKFSKSAIGLHVYLGVSNMDMKMTKIDYSKYENIQQQE